NFRGGNMSVKNSVNLIGNVGKDLELKYTGSGTAYAHMNVAVNKRYKDKDTGETKTITNWFNLTLWAKKAEILSKIVRKGSQVAVSGELVAKTKDGEDGKKIYTYEIKVDE